jgi:hypothetical protein
VTILKLVEKDIVLGDEKKNRAGARRDAIAKARRTTVTTTADVYGENHSNQELNALQNFYYQKYIIK